MTCDLCRYGSSSSVWPSSSSLSARCNSRNSRKPSDRKSKKSQFICHSLLSCVFVNWFPGSVIARSCDRLACLGVFYVSVCVAIPHFLIFFCFIRFSVFCVMGFTNPGNEWLYIEAVLISFSHTFCLQLSQVNTSQTIFIQLDLMINFIFILYLILHQIKLCIIIICVPKLTCLMTLVNLPHIKFRTFLLIASQHSWGMSRSNFCYTPYSLQYECASYILACISTISCFYVIFVPWYCNTCRCYSCLMLCTCTNIHKAC